MIRKTIVASAWLKFKQQENQHDQKNHPDLRSDSNPHSRLCGNPGNAPTTAKIEITIDMVSSMFCLRISSNRVVCAPLF